MAKRTTKTTRQETTEEIIVDKTKHPLVFISHDTRDAEIAEAFSKLLSSVSAGVLKSFRSSDKRGTQGIEYGVEWYPEVMKKLDDASDIVCLLTQNSIDRPWILYEAGVGKGKYNITVLGITIGIPLNKVNNTPFAQFQNCEDGEDDLTKLVIQLIKRIPNSEPDADIIKVQVKNFRDKLAELQKKKPAEKKQDEIKGEALIAKLFEEVKIMYQDLPSRIENRLDPEYMGRRRKRKFHPFMVEEMMHMETHMENPNFGFLMIIGFLKEDFPWIYEIGLETYRELKIAKSKPEKQKLVDAFMKACEMIRHPMIREYSGQHEEMYMFGKEITHFLHRYLDRYLHIEKK